jgi:flagellar biogenesis protein FliO
MRMDETDKFITAMVIAFITGMLMTVLGVFLLLGW